MDVISIVQSVPLSIAIVITVLVLAPTVFAIVKIWAESRAKRQDAETRIKELDSQAKTAVARLEAEGKIQVARLEADAKVKAAELALEEAKQQAVTQTAQIERETKLATDLEIYRAQSDTMRLAQATALQETARALTGLVNTSKATNILIKGSESRLGGLVTGARDVIIEGIEEANQFYIMILQLLWEDPAATRERIKRFAEAWISGDVVAAQAVVDEDVPGALKVAIAPAEEAAKETITP